MQGVSLRCEPGSLTVVVGAVGSGKSSLLAALSRHISRLEGCVKVHHLTLELLLMHACCGRGAGLDHAM